jgi:hypothetical protein
MEIVDRFEYATASDPYRNYCLWQYSPVAPAEDKFRAVNLLYHSFDVAGIDGRAFDFVEGIRSEIGMFRTVWGAKLIDRRLAWEFYFYDYARRDREVSISRVAAAIEPFSRCTVPVNESLNYFMFSIDVDEALVTGGRPLDTVHMYVGNPGSTVSSGICYALGEEETRLENLYYFFDAKTMLQAAADKIGDSAWVDETRMPMERLLWPELCDCHTICVANKQHNDTVYFAGVDVDQLLLFFDRIGYPAAIVDFVRANRDNLDHLLYDVGFDYRTRGREVEVIKSGYYGVF